MQFYRKDLAVSIFRAVIDSAALVLPTPGFLRLPAGDHVWPAYLRQPSEHQASNPRSVASAFRLSGEGDIEDRVHTGTWRAVLIASLCRS